MENIFFIIITFFYWAQSFFIFYGTKKGVNQSKKNIGYEPKVSIIVAARNEEKNISDCLNSLLQLHYPKEKLEIIIVDDHSTDSTVKIIQDFLQHSSSLKFISAQPPTNHLRGKANAISQGIDISTGEIIMMTDADCVVPPTWIKNTVEYFDEKTAVVSGITLLKIQRWFDGMQSLDWMYILALASASMNLKMPLSCIGNNFSFRKKVYDEVGGYKKIPFSVTEDFALFKAMIYDGKWNYHYPIQQETLVFSNPCSTWKDLYRQKRRWAVGGKDIPFRGMFLLVITFCMNIFLVSGLFLNINIILLAFCFIIKLLCDFFVLYFPLKKLEQTSQLRYFFLFELYFIFSILILPFAVFFGGKVIWKEREY